MSEQTSPRPLLLLVDDDALIVESLSFALVWFLNALTTGVSATVTDSGPADLGTSSWARGDNAERLVHRPLAHGRNVQRAAADMLGA